MNLKIMKTKYLMIATVAMLLTACSNDENEVNNGPVAAQVSASFGAESRAVNTDNTWAANDAIGVMVTKVEQPRGGNAATSDMVTRYKNVKYTTKNGGSPATFEAEAGQGIFFQDATETVTFAAYYPYQESAADALPGKYNDGKIIFDTTTFNTTETQAKIDFLYASGATATKGTPTVEFKDNTPVSTQFQHKMAQLKLVIKASTADGFTNEEAKGIFNDDVNAYQLSSVLYFGYFDIQTGEAKNTGSTPVSNWDITGCVHTDNDQTSPYTRTYSLILFPQYAIGGLPLSISVGGNTFTCNDIKPDLEAGKSYTYTITVKKTGLVVSGCTIAPWTVEQEQKGDATMQ